VFIATNRPREPFNGPFCFTLSFSEKEREKKKRGFSSKCTLIMLSENFQSVFAVYLHFLIQF